MSWMSLRCRRALALLLALPLLHGMALAGHAPCDADRATGVPSGGSASAIADAASGSSAHAHHHLTAESGQAPSGLSAPVPSRPDRSPPSNGCSMAMACATVAVATVVVALSEEPVQPGTRQPLTHTAGAPNLAPHAPEPPPPRA